jgi:molybdopterin molybdotransferase
LKNLATNITLEEGIRILNDTQSTPLTETVPVTEGIHRILGEDILATMDQPPFPRSPFDGYALQAGATKGAEKGNPVCFTVNQVIFAGDDPKLSVQSHEAARIMTGAPIPKGADCVIMQEDCKRDGDRVCVLKEMQPMQNYISIGEDIKKDTFLLRRGSLLNYAAIGTLVSQGRNTVSVYKPPRISIISTGNEIQEPGRSLAPAKIYNCNMYSIYARLKELGHDPMMMGNFPDEEDVLKATFAEALSLSDIVITIGGVSVGEKDYSGKIVKSLSNRTLFEGFSHKPGGSILCTSHQGKYVFCLSGNPAAAMISLELIVKPFLYKYATDFPMVLPKQEGILADDFCRPRGTRRIIGGTYSVQDSRLIIHIPEKQSPGTFSPFLDTNCLVFIPTGDGPLLAGSRVEFLSL